MGDMVQVLQHYGFGELPDAYNWRPVRCEFHGDRNASASYMSDGEEREAFSCKACGMKGSPLTLVAQVEGVSNAEALPLLEAITQRPQGSRSKEPARPRRAVKLGDDLPKAVEAKAPKKRSRRRRRVSL